MLKYIFVIALALPVCVFAENNKSKSWDFPPQCFNETNEKLVSAYNHYDKMLMSYVQNKDAQSLANLKASFIDITTVINETCAEGKMPCNENISFVIDLVEFAVKDDKYSNFINSNGIACVEAVRPDIHKCIHDHLGSTNNSTNAGNDTNVNTTGGPGGNIARARGTTNGKDTNISQKHIEQKVYNIIKKTNLEFNSFTCDTTTAIKTCVVSAMTSEHNATCTTEHSKFVESLFDFAVTTKKCEHSQVPGKRSGANSFLFNPVVILLSLVGAMLIK